MNFAPEARQFYERSSAETRRSAETVLEFLSTGFQITWFKESPPRNYEAIIKPGLAVQQQFGLQKEYFLIGHGFAEDFQQRTLLAEPPQDQSFRLENSIRFVASPAPGMEEACAGRAAEMKISIVPVREGNAREAIVRGSAEDALFEVLRTSLWRRDRFDDSEPVRTTSEFFGRQQFVISLLQKIGDGTPVAVFGLRKIGKSSVLHRVQDSLLAANDRVVPTAFLLCNSTRLKSGRWWSVLAELLDQWSKALKSIARKLGSQIVPADVNRLSKLIGEGRTGDAAAVASAFARDFQKLMHAASALQQATGREGVQFVALFDEADELYPHLAAAGSWKEDFFLLWNTLQTAKRGLDEPRRLTYVLGGVNPSGVELGSLLDQPNPLFEMSSRYLGPMNLRESGELLRGLGGAMGLIFEDAAVEKAFEITGGHPLLLRKLGSFIHDANLDRNAVKLVTSGEVERIFGRSQRRFYAHIEWILTHLQRVAPDEYRLLKDIAVGGAERYRSDWAEVEFREVFADHLARYGLVKMTTDTPEIAIGVITEVLRRPAPSDYPTQKKDLREAVDQIESSIRARISEDLLEDGDLQMAVKAITEAIPREASQRPKDRNALQTLGLSGGLRALAEALNWGDYLLILEKFHEKIRWFGPVLSKHERMEIIRSAATEVVQLVRHNNDGALKQLIASRGYSSVHGQLLSAIGVLSG